MKIAISKVTKNSESTMVIAAPCSDKSFESGNIASIHIMLTVSKILKNCFLYPNAVNVCIPSTLLKLISNGHSDNIFSTDTEAKYSLPYKNSIIKFENRYIPKLMNSPKPPCRRSIFLMNLIPSFLFFDNNDITLG